jgi:hypothetical protein
MILTVLRDFSKCDFPVLELTGGFELFELHETSGRDLVEEIGATVKSESESLERGISPQFIR